MKLGYTSEVSTKQDLSFSSAAEIQSFINANKSGPNMSSSNTDLQKFRENNFLDQDGNLVKSFDMN